MNTSDISSAELASGNIAERAELARKLGRFLNLERPEDERTAVERLALVVAADSAIMVRKVLVEELRNCRVIPAELRGLAP